MKFLEFFLIFYITYCNIVYSAKLKKEDFFENNKKALVSIKSRSELPFVGDTGDVIIKRENSH
jgi:hypothetical protein